MPAFPKKSNAKKAASAKNTAAKVPVKKVAPKKAATSKKALAPRAPATKTTARKAPAKKGSTKKSATVSAAPVSSLNGNQSSGRTAVGLLELPKPDGKLLGSRVSHHQGAVKAVRNLTYDTYELTVTCPEGSVPLNHTAGQYATLFTTAIDKPRSYSFAKAPSLENEGEYTFFVRVVPGGKFSGWLDAEDRTGEPLTIAGPLGAFGLDDSDKTIVGIAGGSGMSAIKAVLEEAAEKQVPRNAVFLYGARTQADLYCAEEIESIRANWHPDYTFTSTMVLSAEPMGTDWTGPTGNVTDHLDAAFLQPGLLNPDDMTVFFCGPPAMVDAGVEVLTANGLPRASIHFDKFEDASSPAPVVDNSMCVLCDECLLVKPVEDCIVEASSIWEGLDGHATATPVEPGATSGVYYNSLFVDDAKCIRCYACVDICPVGAISPDHHDAIPLTIRQTVSA